MFKSILKENNLPYNLCDEVVNRSIDILNRSATKSLERVTLYAAWSFHKPNVKNMREFGCIVLILTLGGK